MLELKQLTPPAAESVTTRSVPYLVTRQADSLEGGHGFGGVRQRLPNTRSHQLEIGAKLGAQKFLNCLSVRSGRLRRGLWCASPGHPINKKVCCQVWNPGGTFLLRLSQASRGTDRNHI
jgi:hypothetical protein